MASINSISIYLHQRGKGALNATLQLRYIYQGILFYISSGIRVKVKDWNQEKGRININTKAGKDSDSNQIVDATNRQIQAFLLRAKEVVLDAEREGLHVTPAYLREKLARKKADVADDTKLDSESEALGLTGLWQQFIEESRKSLALSESTVKGYTRARNHFLLFEEKQVPASTPKEPFTFDSLTPQAVERFVTFMKNKGLISASCAVVIKNLKVFCKWAFEHGHTTAAHYPRFKKPTAEKTDFVFLTEEELDRFAKAPLPSHLERTRDRFILQAATGLRYSDSANLKPENRQGNRLSIVTIKTKDSLTIPLSPVALAIYAKYEENGLPPIIQNQPYNREIKEAARLAGITEQVSVTVIQKGKRDDSVFEKWEKITSHTARRTFIIHALERGVRPEVLMKVTGHKDIKTMMHYVKISQSVVEQEFERAWAKSS